MSKYDLSGSSHDSAMPLYRQRSGLRDGLLLAGGRDMIPRLSTRTKHT